MQRHPMLMRVESGSLTLVDTSDGSTRDVIEVTRHVPLWWRNVEQKLRLDIGLALAAKRYEGRADIIWAESEKVGIALSFMGLKKPLVVVAHHMSSPMKARLARMTGVVSRWDGIGYISDEAAGFFKSYFQTPEDRLFQYESANYLEAAEGRPLAFDGPIFSIGTAKRDYSTLIHAAKSLENVRVEICASSRFGDRLRDDIGGQLPHGVALLSPLTEDELIEKYQDTPFAVVPLHQTSHTGAGINAVLEAGAFSKLVVATDTGGMRTFVRDGETGLLVPPYDVQAWISALERLTNDPELTRRMGIAARRYVEERFSPKRVNANIRQFLYRLADERRGHGRG